MSAVLRPVERAAWFVLSTWPWTKLSRYHAGGCRFLEIEIWKFGDWQKPFDMFPRSFFLFMAGQPPPPNVPPWERMVQYSLIRPYFIGGWNMLWGGLISLEPQTTIYKWLFQLDDSQSLHRKWLFHQTSIYKWLFGVPGGMIFMLAWVGRHSTTCGWTMNRISFDETEFDFQNWRIELWTKGPWLFRVFRGWNTTQLYRDYKGL